MYIHMYMYQFRNGFWKTLYGTHTGCFRYLAGVNRYRNYLSGSLIRNTHFRDQRHDFAITFNPVQK